MQTLHRGDGKSFLVLENLHWLSPVTDFIFASYSINCPGCNGDSERLTSMDQSTCPLLYVQCVMLNSDSFACGSTVPGKKDAESSQQSYAMKPIDKVPA